MRVKSIGIIGYGAFGKFIHELLGRFAPSVEVRVYSSRQAPDARTFFTLEDACVADIVILAVPIHAFEETLMRTLPLIPATSLIVDVATVKLHTARLLAELAPGRRYAATHPMFGPESYLKRDQDIAGFRIVVAAHTLPEVEYAALRDALISIGFDIVEMTAERHDKHLAETLFLTHFIGQIIGRAKFERTEIDTVSFGFLMNAAESVRHDTALFRDVFRFNPYCSETLDRFERAEEEVRAILELPTT